MKICYLASAASVHTTKWANFFSSKGHQVDVLSFEPANGMQPGVTVHRLGKHMPFKLHYFGGSRMARRLLHQIQPDILHAHYASGYATPGRLCSFHPYVVSVWGSDIFDFPRKSVVHRKIVASNLHSADCLCSTSRMMAEEIRKLCPREIHVTPFGVDCQQFQPRIPPPPGSPFVVGIVKTLEPKYGVEFLLRAFALFSLRSQHARDVRLLIAGEGSLRRSLQRLATDLNIAERTSFLGQVSHREIPQLLHQFDVFVAPSISPSESFGVAVVEASASALPVIASDIGGLPEVVQDRITGMLVPPRDPEAICTALEQLFHNPALRFELGSNGRKFVLANYGWEENAARMERIYESVLQKVSLAVASAPALSHLPAD